MQNATRLRESAERHFLPQHDRDEKGSAMATIQADADANRVKTDRLRALRLARDATIVVAPMKPKRASKKAARAAST